MGVVEDLIRARETFERREWVAAYDALSELDPETLTGDDFAQLATAAALLGRRNDSVQALQRAYQLNLDAGETLAALRCAFWVAMSLTMSGETAVGGGWIARAERLIDEVTEDVVEHGYVLLPVMVRQIFSGELDSAYQLAVRIVEYGRRFSEPDLLAMGLCSQGRMLLYEGRVPEGLAHLDEAMVGVAAGEVSPIFSGHVYCTMIEGCQELGDLARVIEWTTALTAWCDAQPGMVLFTGQCAVHRGQIMRAHGAFAEALDEFERAVERYVLEDTTPAAGLAMSERGDVLRIRGDLQAAEEAFDAAIRFGHEAQPGLALLWLARGRQSAALGAIRRLLAEPRNPVHRSQLLPAGVQILLAAGETDQASALADELANLAESFECAAQRATAGHAVASVALARDEAAGAVDQLRVASRLWHELGETYELAGDRTQIGRE